MCTESCGAVVSFSEAYVTLYQTFTQRAAHSSACCLWLKKTSFKQAAKVQVPVTASICPSEMSLSKTLDTAQHQEWCLRAESDLWPAWGQNRREPRGSKGDHGNIIQHWLWQRQLLWTDPGQTWEAFQNKRLHSAKSLNEWKLCSQAACADKHQKCLNNDSTKGQVSGCLISPDLTWQWTQRIYSTSTEENI